MISVFKDHYRVGQLLAILFIIGVAISIYQIYSLPEGLSIMSGYRQAFLPVYMVLGFTFILGFFTIYYTLQHRREVIVFRDKKLEQDIIDRENSVKNVISLDGVKESLNADDRKEILRGALHAICKQLDAGQGAIYEAIDSNGVRKVELKSGYALNMGESTIVSYEFGEGLIGQAAANGKTLYIDDVPEGYIKIVSGLGSASPRFLLIVPLKTQEKTTGVIEIASFSAFTPDQRKFVEDAAQLIGNTISTQ
jgi:hypothetical protein